MRILQPAAQDDTVSIEPLTVFSEAKYLKIRTEIASEGCFLADGISA
jgi:hypothetical protein